MLAIPIVLYINWAVVASHFENPFAKLLFISNRLPDSQEGLRVYAKSYWVSINTNSALTFEADPKCEMMPGFGVYCILYHSVVVHSTIFDHLFPQTACATLRDTQGVQIGQICGARLRSYLFYGVRVVRAGHLCFFFTLESRTNSWHSISCTAIFPLGITALNTFGSVSNVKN